MATNPASEIAGLGPFRLEKQTVIATGTANGTPERNFALRLEGRSIREIVFPTLTGPLRFCQDRPYLGRQKWIRFQAGDIDVISRIGADNYDALDRDHRAKTYHLHYLGHGL